MNGALVVLLWLGVGLAAMFVWYMADAMLDAVVQRRLDRRWSDLQRQVNEGRRDFGPDLPSSANVRRLDKEGRHER